MNLDGLEEAIALFKAGKPEEARPLLIQILRSDSRDEIAWMYLTKTLSSQAERLEALEHCLKLNPHSKWARKELAELKAQLKESQEDDAAQAGPAVVPTPVDDSPSIVDMLWPETTEPAQAAPAPKAAQTAKRKRAIGTSKRWLQKPWQRYAVIGVPLVIIVGVLALMLWTRGRPTGAPTVATQTVLQTQEIALPIATQIPTAVAQPSPTQPSVPTHTPVPTPLPSPIPTVAPIAELPVISPDNAEQVVLQSQWLVDEVVSLAFSPDGQMLAAGAWDGTLRIWDTATLLGPPWGRGQELFQLGLPFGVNSVAFSPDGNTLAFGISTIDEPIRLLDVSVLRTEGANGEPAIRSLIGHGDGVKSLAFAPDGRTLASSSFDETVRLWDVQSGDQLGAIEGYYVENVVFSPDGRVLATAFFDAGYTTLIWDVSEVLRSGSQNDRQLLTLDGGPGVTFSHDGQRLVTAEQRISVWEVSDLPAQLAPNNLLTLPGHTELVQVLALSPDGRVLASGSRNRKIKLWDLNRGTELKTLVGHSNRVLSLTFSPDGSILASAADDGTIRLWGASGP